MDEMTEKQEEATMLHHSVKKERWVAFTKKQPTLGRNTYQKKDADLDDNIENITYGQYCGHNLASDKSKSYWLKAVWQYAD